VPTFAGFPACANPTGASIAVLGIPDATPYTVGQSSHSAGAPGALRAILKGYATLPEQYDFDLEGLRPSAVVDCGDLVGDPSDPGGTRERIQGAIGRLLEAGVVPVVLGGDDSVPIPMFQAFASRGPLTVIQVDAHLDWRDEVRGERFGYSSPMRRASEMDWIEGMVQVGLRGIGSARAAEVADARGWGASIVTAAEVHRAGIGVALDRVPVGARCLITVDCDGLDPSIMPAVMAPVPGGLWYHQVLELLHGVAAKATIVGFDLVEFVPERDPNGVAALTAARVVCNGIAAIAASRARPAAS
jgi:agmatinase